MANLTPTPKVTAGVAGGALSIVLVYLLGQFGITLPEQVAQAITLLLGFAASWLKGEVSGDGTDVE